MEEVSLTIDEAKLKKMADEMLRQRCTSGDEHQYHIDQMKNFLQSDIVWESRKEILVSPHPRKTTLSSSCQEIRSPALSLINQDLLYLKKEELVQSNDPPVSRVNTLRSGEDNMKLMELMEHYTKLFELLQKSEGSEGFHQIIDFLTTSHIMYALTKSPTIYVSLIEQFWQTASVSTLKNGDMEITATIDGKVKVVSEESIRRHLKLEDYDSISTLPTSNFFEQLDLMGYVSNSDNLTFQKGHFSPQWKFLIHTILHCLSSKKTAWEQFSSNIATAIICLATNRTFNFSKLIFDAMGEGSTILVESHHIHISAPSTSQPPTSPPSMQTTHVAEEAATMPHDSPLLRVYSLRSDEGSMTLNELMVLCTTLSKKVETLESDLRYTKLTYGAA
ncbi:hypothetical protein Tco_1501858 [Tanacetum coccineum]